MGEVVDMTGRIVVADEHPLGAESVKTSARKTSFGFVWRGTKHLM
jgi:hypothetical protein